VAAPAPTTGYSGPRGPECPTLLSFQTNLWTNISGLRSLWRPVTRQGGQATAVSRRLPTIVNLAYQATGPLVNFTSPAQSELVVKVGGGHNCFPREPRQECATMMTTWIQNWIGGTSSTAMGIVLTPPTRSECRRRQALPGRFEPVPGSDLVSPPEGSSASIATVPMAPHTNRRRYFASSDPSQAYLAAQSKLNLNTPSQSRFRRQASVMNFTTAGRFPAGGRARPAPGKCRGHCWPRSPPIAKPSSGYQRRSDARGLESALPQAGDAWLGRQPLRDQHHCKVRVQDGHRPPRAYDHERSSRQPADLTLTSGVGWVTGWGIKHRPPAARRRPRRPPPRSSRR